MVGPDAYTWRELARKSEEERELRKLSNKISKIEDIVKIDTLNIEQRSEINEVVQEQNIIQNSEPQLSQDPDSSEQQINNNDTEVTQENKNNKKRGRKRKNENVTDKESQNDESI